MKLKTPHQKSNLPVCLITREKPSQTKSRSEHTFSCHSSDGSPLKARPTNLYPLLIRLGLVTLTGLIVILVPRFADLMALVGASCCTFLAFIMPALCHLNLFSASMSKNELTLDYVLVGTGVVGAIIGTLDAIANIFA